jgi:hypothetical protein
MTLRPPTLRLACVLCVLLLGCGDSASGMGGDSSGGAGGAGGAGGEAAGCVCDVTSSGFGHYADKECFCLEFGFGCGSEISIDRVLEPACPGPVIHPISASCKIGGWLRLADNDLEYESYGYYFDRDTSELVGLYISTDVTQYCGGDAASVTWGNVAASCELCDPCADPESEFPPCPDPEE